jgi:transcriptional regulator with XRE-family HTH domain
VDPGDLIRSRRLANGLTQAQLATRAGSTQAAISRLERGDISPTLDTVRRLLEVIGEELVLSTRRETGDYDRRRLLALRERSPASRLEQALDWNRFAGEVARAGAAAREPH